MDDGGRHSLIALSRSGRHCAFLSRAYPYLEQVAQDPEIALLALQSLVALGLGGPARELLDARAEFTENADLLQLRRSLAGLPTGRVAWTEFTAVFEQNWRTIEVAHPHLARLEPALRGAIGQMQLFRALDGSLHLSRRGPGKLRQWIPAMADESLLNQIPATIDRSTVVVGTLLTRASDRIYSIATEKMTGPQIPLFMIEPEIERFSAWLHVRDRGLVLVDPRIAIFGGPQAVEEFKQHLIQHEDLAPPVLRLAFGADADVVSAVDDAIRCVNQQRRTAYDGLATSMARRSSDRTDQQCSERLAPGAIVLGFASRFTTMIQHSMRDIGEALSRNGYRFKLVTEAAEHRHTNALTVARIIEDLDPALLVMINHFRCEQPEMFGGVPILTWVQDPMPIVFNRATGASLSSRDFVCGYYSEQCRTDFHYPEHSLLPIHLLPVSETRFHDRIDDDHDADRWACDLMYVGHYNGTPASHTQAIKAQYPPALHELLDQIRTRVDDIRRDRCHPQFGDWLKLVQEEARALTLDVPDAVLTSLSQYHAHRLFDIAHRHETLEWVGRWATQRGRRFRLYGKDWHLHPALGRFAAGPLEHGEPLRRAYRGARLTLQTIPTGFWHQRSFEALASGSLTIARFSPWDFAYLSLNEFQRRKSAEPQLWGMTDRFPSFADVVFHDEAEFQSLVEQLLENDGRRRQLLGEFRQVVQSTLTYGAVVPRLIEQVRSRLSCADRGEQARPTEALAMT